LTIREKLLSVEPHSVIRFIHTGSGGKPVAYVVYVTENHEGFASITGRYVRADSYQTYEHLLLCPYGGFGYDMCVGVEILLDMDFDLGI
jgi:hypothetical protein